MNDQTATVLLDLDQTLVHTTALEPGRPLPTGWKEVISSKGRLYATIGRPSALAFLQALKNRKRKVCLLSSANDTEFQSRILAAHGMRQFFDEVFRHDCFLPVVAPFVLVDDLDAHCAGIEDKFRQLGLSKFELPAADWLQAVQEHLVTCKPFWNGRENEPLSATLSAIDESKIACQIARNAV